MKKSENDSPLPEIWTTVSHKVLASILIDPGAIWPVLDIIGQRRDWFPPKERPIFDAILACLEANTPPTIEAVNSRLNGSIEPGLVKVIAALFNEDDNRLLIYNTQQLRDIGILAKIRALGRELSGLQDIDSISDVAGQRANELAGLLSVKQNRDSRGEAVNDAAWAEVEQFKGNGIPTGLKWFDDLTGGQWPGMNYWIAGAYKSGKSTLMRNIVLNTARSGCPVGVLCAEGSREMFALDCQAMMATEYLLNQGWQKDNLRIDGLMIMRFYWRQGVLVPAELAAINKAKEEWNKLPINIWDTRDGIRNTATLRYLVKHGKLNFGTRAFWADYSQLFGSGGTLFERQSETSKAIQEIAADENIVFGMLTQQNEQQVRSGGESHSPGVKGGGDAAAAADFMIVPELDSDTGILKALLKLSRRSKMGITGYHFVAPSGLIMDKWGTVDITQME